MARAAAVRVRFDARAFRRALLVLVAVALVVAGVIASGLAVVATTHEMRALNGELARVQKRHDTLMVEHSRLLLERGALTSYQSIERLARDELNMEFPARVERLPE